MSRPPPPAVVKDVARRVAHMTDCGERTAKDVVCCVLDNLITEDVERLAKWRGLKVATRGS